MAKLDNARVVVEIVKIVTDVYHSFDDRRRGQIADDDAKAKRIRDLESELERLKTRASE